MLKIGDLELTGGPKIVYAVSAYSPDLKNLPVDIFEARVDLFDNPSPLPAHSVVNNLNLLNIPILLTVRSKQEGGGADLGDGARLDLFNACLPAADAVDVELASSQAMQEVVEKARANGKTVILSFHSFENTPTDEALDQLMAQAKVRGADIFKIAAQPKSVDDVKRLREFTRKYRDEGIVAISMGEMGSRSRVEFGKDGSLLTYTSSEPVLGQIPLEELRKQIEENYHL